MNTNEKPSPLELLMRDYLPAPEAAALEQQVATIRELPPTPRLENLRSPVYGNDPNELFKHRFLYRGGIALLCGPTGIGKSSFLVQGAIHWAVGRALFDVLPGDIFQKQGMRILIVQAENDEGDLAEMRDGVLAGCDELSDEEKRQACRNIRIATVTDKSAEAFASLLEALLTEQGPVDLVIVDPAFAYLGGDSNSQKDVSFFMRELLNPLVHRHRVGLLLAHHTNKPLRGKEKDSWAAGDFAYLGAGSAEWINPARAALAIRSLGSDSVFELRGAKRGKRLRWQDDNGNPTTVQYIAHHGQPGVICWRKATPDEVSELLDGGENKGGRRKVFDDVECVHAVRQFPGESQAHYLELILGKLDCGRTTAFRMLQQCVQHGWLQARGDRVFKRYDVTEKGLAAAESRPSAVCWVS